MNDKLLKRLQQIDSTFTEADFQRHIADLNALIEVARCIRDSTTGGPLPKQHKLPATRAALTLIWIYYPEFRTILVPLSVIIAAEENFEASKNN